MRAAKKHAPPAVAPFTVPEDLVKIGLGQVAYIRTITHKTAQTWFPGAGIPDSDEVLFALMNADGTPSALTDTLSAAFGYASESEIAIVGLQ